jgi:hypothetical protein
MGQQMGRILAQVLLHLWPALVAIHLPTAGSDVGNQGLVML